MLQGPRDSGTCWLRFLHLSRVTVRRESGLNGEVNVPSLALYMHEGMRRRGESRLSGGTVGALPGCGAALSVASGGQRPRLLRALPPMHRQVAPPRTPSVLPRALSAPLGPDRSPSGQPPLPRRSPGQSPPQPHTPATRATPGAQTPRGATRRTCAAADGPPELLAPTGPCWQPAPPRRRKQIFLFVFPSTL